MNAAKMGLNGRSNEALPLIVAWLAGWATMILVDEAVHIPGPTKWGGALVAVVVVLLLGLYYHARRGSLNVDRASDALYYLGLLLTLGSLIWSLVSPTIHGESEYGLSDRANEIIGNFGIALVSTVAGIVGRISLQSFAGQDQRIPEEKDVQDARLHRDVAGQNQQTSAEREARTQAIEINRELSLMAQHLRQQMREAADAFSAFNRSTMQEAEATRSAALRHTEDVKNRLEEMAQATIETMEKTHQEMIDWLCKTDEALGQRIEAADKLTRAMLSQVASTKEKVWEVATCMERERAGLEGIGEIIRREVGAAAEVLGVLPENLARTNEALDGLQAAVIRAGETLKEMTEETQRRHETLRRYTEEREKGLIRQIEQNRRDMDREVRAWSGHVERAAETLDVARTSTGTLRQAAGTTDRKVERRRVGGASQRLRGAFGRLLERK